MDPMYWLVIIAALILIEIVTLGLTTIWFASGAVVAFIASILDASFQVQMILFFAISFILLYFTRPIALKFLNSQRTATNVDGLIGQEAKVTQTIDNNNQKGTAVVNGQEWTARAEEDLIIETGSTVIIKKIAGVKLIVTLKKEEV